MPTFAGNYVQEPSDFATVTTEATLIQVADDPATPTVPDTVLAWADLDVTQKAALTATIDAIVVRKEGIVNGFLMAGGYAIPADHPTVDDFAVRLVWIDLRYRKGQFTEEEYERAKKSVMDELKLIGSGAMVLIAEEGTDEAPSATVYAVGTSERIMSRETLEDF